jgi:two-component system cell cycle response regulator CpdR
MAHILIAEDNATLAAHIQRVLKKSGHTVRMVNNAIDTWRAVGREHFDAVLVDTGLPGMDGLELAQKALVENADVKVVFLTGFSAVAMGNGAKRARPFHINEMGRKLTALMQGSFYEAAAEQSKGMVVYADFAARKNMDGARTQA